MSLVAKWNQPALYAQLTALPWNRVATRARTRDRGHGRVETRNVKATEVRAGIDFPHALQAVQITRRRSVNGGPTTTEAVHAITSLPTHQASPALLADLTRDHWSVEVRHEVALSESANRTGGSEIDS